MQNKRKRQMKRSSCCLRPANCESKHLNAHSCNGFCYEVPSTAYNTLQADLSYQQISSEMAGSPSAEPGTERPAMHVACFQNAGCKEAPNTGSSWPSVQPKPQEPKPRHCIHTPTLLFCLPSESVHDFFVFSFSLKQSDESNPGKHSAFTSASLESQQHLHLLTICMSMLSNYSSSDHETEDHHTLRYPWDIPGIPGLFCLPRLFYLM